MRYLFAIAMIVFLPLSGAGSVEAADIKAVYRFYCSQCHGLEGRGDGINNREEMPVSPRNHTSAEEMEKLTDDEIISVIKEGGAATSKSTVMPPFGKTLTEAEITGLKDYLRTLCNC